MVKILFLEGMEKIVSMVVMTETASMEEEIMTFSMGEMVLIL